MSPPTRATVDAWERRMPVDVLLAEDLASWPSPDSYDLVQFRGLGLRGAKAREDIWDWLAEVPLLSDPLLALQRDHDKILGGWTLLDAGLPVPPFALLDEPWITHGLPAGPPWIVKPVRGGQGAGVALVSSLDEALAHQDEVGRPCLLQEYIPTRRCCRVLCAPDDILAAYARVSDEVVANVALGAAREDLDDSDVAIRELGQAMVAAVGGHVMGADVLEGEDGRLWALEVNSGAGFDHERQDIADRWVDRLIGMC
jgi:glutathione synthase/RimK-type ligase-like ATP-grasp enzyme